VAGVRTASANPGLVTAQLKGDARVIARKGRTDSYQFSIGYGKLDLDVMNTLQGTSAASGVVDSGSGGTATAKYRVAAPAPLPYFKLEFKIDDLDPGLGTLKVTFYKSQITGSKMLSTSSDAFNQPSFDGEAFALDGTLGTDVGVVVDFDLFVTQTALD